MSRIWIIPSLPQLRGVSAPGTWRYRIAYNACLVDLRQQPAVAAVAFDADREPSIVDPTPGPAEIVVERDNLSVAPKRFPHDRRAAITLVDACGLGDVDADAAEVLGVRAGTIGPRLSRARTALHATVGGAAA